jgi:hypothetical protein
MANKLLNEFHRLYALAQEREHQAYRYRVKAGHGLIVLQEHIEAQGEDWWSWYKRYSVRSRQQAEHLMKMARDDEELGPPGLRPRRDRKDYMREFMRRKRAEAPKKARK